VKIVLTRRLPASVVATLRAVADVDMPAEGAYARRDLTARLADADALMSMLSDPVDRTVLDAGPRLAIVANVAVGFDNIDVPYARSRGIAVTNTPGVLTDAVADFTWALILAVTRRVGEGERLVRSGGWRGWAFDLLLGSSLADKQLGIIGFGRIGRAVAARAGAFGMRVAHVSARGGRSPELDQLLHTSDVVSLHVPLTPETRHLIDRKALARMKRSAYLVNTSRGPVVDEEGLAWALNEHLIAGAAIDVYEHEPQVHADLLRLENVVLAPHLGSATTETRTAMADLAARNVLAVLAGQAPLTPVA
jgi:glyoxylate reductase